MKRKIKIPNSWQIQVTVSFVILLILIESQIESAIVPPPWSNPEKNPCASLPGGWQLLYWPPVKKCFKIFQLGYPCPETMELTPVPLNSYGGNDEVRAECRCPPGTAQSPTTNKCHTIFERGPCEKGQYFGPVQETNWIRSNSKWGNCKEPKACPENMMFWPKDRKCYTLFTRGPCPKGKLLVKDNNDLAQCKCEKSGELKRFFYHPEETCHEHYTTGPCQRFGNIFLPGGICGCHSQLPHYHEPNGQCYELGTLGPCPPGHIFTIPDNAKGDVKYAECQCKEGYVRWSDGICYRLYTRGPCDSNEFLINATSCVNNFCGKGRLYFPEQKTCYRIGTQGPCSTNQVVIFDFTARPSIDGISYNGLCGCSGVIRNLDQQCSNPNSDTESNVNTCESTPGMIELNGQCFKLYSRGPCGPGQWLEPLKNSDNSNNDNNTNDSLKRIKLNKAKCQCRPGYTSYESQPGIMGCYAPTVGLARYLNNRVHNVQRLQSKKLMLAQDAR